MAFKLVDRARQSVSGTPGTGVITLSAAVSGYQTMSAAGINNADTFPYQADDVGNTWEFGVATFSSTAGGQLTRAVTKSSSGVGVPLNLTSKAVISACVRAEDINLASSLAGLVDVDTAGVVNDDVLSFDDTIGKWVPVPPGGAGGSLATLSDVTLTSPADDQVLTYVSGATKWENKTLAAVARTGAYADLSGKPTIPTNGSFTLDGLSNVTITAVADDDVVTWNSGASKWENKPSGGGASGVIVEDNGSSLGTATTINFSGMASVSFAGSTAHVTGNTGGGGGGGAGTVGTPPTFVQFGSGISTSGSSAVTLGGAPTNGNMLIAITWQDGNSQPTAASGWTLKETQSDGAYWIQVFTKIAGASESTTQTPASGGAGSHWSVGMWEINGQNASPDVLYLTNYNASNTRAIATPGIAQSSGTFFCASIASNTATDTLSDVYGTATIDANLTSANIPAAFGHSDSNYTTYSLIGKQSALVASAWAIAIVKS